MARRTAQEISFTAIRKEGGLLAADFLDQDKRFQAPEQSEPDYDTPKGLEQCNELRYVLDPADVMGFDYPSETFRVLKNNELREFGEYRTRRLVLEAWDQINQPFENNI